MLTIICVGRIRTAGYAVHRPRPRAVYGLCHAVNYRGVVIIYSLLTTSCHRSPSDNRQLSMWPVIGVVAAGGRIRRRGTVSTWFGRGAAEVRRRTIRCSGPSCHARDADCRRRLQRGTGPIRLSAHIAQLRLLVDCYNIRSDDPRPTHQLGGML